MIKLQCVNIVGKKIFAFLLYWLINIFTRSYLDTSIDFNNNNKVRSKMGNSRDKIIIDNVRQYNYFPPNFR